MDYWDNQGRGTCVHLSGTLFESELERCLGQHEDFLFFLLLDLYNGCGGGVVCGAGDDAAVAYLSPPYALRYHSPSLPARPHHHHHLHNLHLHQHQQQYHQHHHIYRLEMRWNTINFPFFCPHPSHHIELYQNFSSSFLPILDIHRIWQILHKLENVNANSKQMRKLHQLRSVSAHQDVLW